MFTREELEEMFKYNLVELATYQGLEVDMRMLKEDIIDEILESQEERMKEAEPKEPPASVRIQRIRDSQKE